MMNFSIIFRWNRVIGGSLSLMRNFNFVLPKNLRECADGVKAMSRLVQTVVIKDMIVNEMEILEVLKKFDLLFKVLMLENVTIDAQIFYHLVCMFQLDILVTSRVKVINEIERSDDYPSNKLITAVKPLNLLVVQYPDDSILDSLTKSNFQSKKLALDFRYAPIWTIWTSAKLMTFLEQQKSVTRELAIKDFAGIISLIEIQLKSWKLEKLWIKCSTTDFINLIKSQPNLTELEIDCFDFSQELFNSIHELKHLKKLRLKVCHSETLILPQAQSKYNADLKTLAVTYTHRISSLQFFETSFGTFGNIENLQIGQRVTPEMMFCIQTRLTSLKNLKIPEITGSFPVMSIPSLRMLEVDCVTSMKRLNALLAQNPSLEELKIGNVSESGLKYHHFELSSMNLRKVSIGSISHTEINNFFLHNLKKSCPRIEMLTVCIDRSSQFCAENIQSKIKVRTQDTHEKESVFTSKTFSKSVFEKLFIGRSVTNVQS